MTVPCPRRGCVHQGAFDACGHSYCPHLFRASHRPTTRLRPLNQVEIRDRLEEIAEKLRVLRPEGRDPERYHVDKDQILRDIGKLKEAVRLGVRD